jgi:exodeoxyribonuclease V gamma subunit
MIKLFTSNRLELLAEALARVLEKPLATPLDKEVILVQSKGMERWISLQLAERHGICANCRFPFPNTFVQEIFQAVLKDLPQSSLFEPGMMTWRVMSALPPLVEEPEFETLRVYLETAPRDLRLFQLSQRIADLFDQYLVFRPGMMAQWGRGNAGHWQALLWRQLVRGNEQGHRVARAKQFFEALEESHQAPPGLPARISVFGISALPRFYVQVFSSLARFAQVNLFLMSPCQEYWGDILATWEMKKKARSEKALSGEELHMEKGNSLLASMGALGRDFFEITQEFDCDETSFHEEPGEENLLVSIQSDILRLQERKQKKKISEDDSSVEIHSCHGPMREVEVLRDRLLLMFEEDRSLLPKDILVMVPDIESYAPYIQAVFDASPEDPQRIPFSIADRSIRKEGSLVDVFLAILNLEGSRFGGSQVLDLLECEAVRRKHGFSEDDLDQVRTWISETRIRWGIDGRHKAEMGLPSIPQNTWRAGIERLLLGYAMPGHDEALFEGILPYDAVEGSKTEVLGAFIAFAEKLLGVPASLAPPRTLKKWSRTLLALMEDVFEPDEETEREAHFVRGILNELNHIEETSDCHEEIHLRVMRSHLGHALDLTGLGFGFITGGVTFCAMLPMRSIPFKVLCLLGMDGSAYPRQSRVLGFDLMAKYPKRGDRSRRNDDRYLFLEALLSARKKLYISYVGQSVQDNSAIPPSVLVSELMDYMEQGFEIPGKNIRDHIHTRQRLQAFSPEYFRKHKKRITYSQDNYEIAARMLEGRIEPKPFLNSPLSEPEEIWKKVDLQDLCSFFSHPAKFLFNKRLGIYLEEGSVLPEEREPFEVKALERYSLEEFMLRRRIRGRDLRDDYLLAAASGRLPHGTVGECVYENLSSGVDRFAKDLSRRIGEDETLDALSFEIEVGRFTLLGSLDHVLARKMMRYRYARIRARDIVMNWIRHLALNVAGASGYPRRSLLAGLSQDKKRDFLVYEYAPLEGGEEILEGLLERYWEGLRDPLHFFPESSWSYWKGKLQDSRRDAKGLREARAAWEGNDFTMGEKQDLYYQLCFRHQDPIDSEFERIAEEIFAPLMNHFKEMSL